MANSISSFFETLVAASSDASSVLVGTTALLDAVYLDYAPNPVAPFQTLNVPIPASVASQVADAGSGDPVFSNVSAGTKAIELNKHPQYGFVINDFEQYTSAQQLRNVFLDPAIKGIAEYANASIAALINATDLPSNPVISTTGGLITSAQFLGGMATLADQKVPVQDTPNLSFLMAPTVYTNLLDDDTWTKESTVGVLSAQEAHRGGNLRVGYGAMLGMDQQLPTTGTKPTRTFKSVYMHRYAIGLVSRPLPPAPSDGQSVFCTYARWKGFSIRIVMQYQASKGGWVVNIDAGFGLAVLRPEMAQLFSTTEA